MNIILDINECPSLPHPEPYSGVRTSRLEIQEFIQKTVKLNKQPIVVFGANWCPDARLFEGVIQLPVVKSFLERNANILNIDVGNYEMNTELFSFFDKNYKLYSLILTCSINNIFGNRFFCFCTHFFQLLNTID